MYLFLLVGQKRKKLTYLGHIAASYLPRGEKSSACAEREGLLPKRNGVFSWCGKGRGKRGEYTQVLLPLLCCNLHLLNETPVPSLRHVRLIFNKLPIHQRGQASSLSFLPLQDSACHVTENLWDHSNSVSLAESHMTQQQLQCRLPTVVNKPSVWLCSFAMPCARSRQLADRSLLAYVWSLASRCERKCCAVNIDEALLQEAVRAHHQHCLRLDSTAQGGCRQQKFPSLCHKDQLHAISS